MPLQRAVRVLLAVVVLALTACGGNEKPAKPTLPAETPGATSAAAVSPASGAEPTGAAPGAGLGLIVATPPVGEVIVKEPPQPTASTGAPPSGSVPLPTIAPNLDADGDGFYTYAELEHAVAALYPTYVWPNAYPMDPTTILMPLADAKAHGGLFEVRAEYTIIGIDNFCAWSLAWLDGFRQGDTALMTLSIEQLLREPQRDPMMDTSTRDYLKGLIKNAQLGDPAGLQQNVTSSCSGMVFMTPTPATPISSSPVPST